MVQDQHYTKVRGLPSWVPDFSARPPGQLDIIENAPYWCASGGLAFSGDLPPAPGIRLPLKGIKVDRIAEVDSQSGCLFVRVAEIALGLPAIYKQDALIPDRVGKEARISSDLVTVHDFDGDDSDSNCDCLESYLYGTQGSPAELYRKLSAEVDQRTTGPPSSRALEEITDASGGFVVHAGG
jgi:hypothetical protein